VIKKIVILFYILQAGCAVYPDAPPFVPFKTYYSQPPGNMNDWPQPVQLECIDESNIYVYTNGAWWYSGPRRMSTHGWVPTGGGWYLQPGQVWPDKANYPPPYLRKQ
jgi:hypothetical protein